MERECIMDEVRRIEKITNGYIVDSGYGVDGKQLKLYFPSMTAFYNHIRGIDVAVEDERINRIFKDMIGLQKRIEVLEKDKKSLREEDISTIKTQENQVQI
jgi:uncharacterized protein YdcH (DUF465 family)